MAPHRPERELLIACCAWPHEDRTLDRIRAAATDLANWQAFEKLAAAHRVEPLVHHALATSGAPAHEHVQARLARRARALAEQDLRLAAETVRLQRAFAAAGVSMRVLKGAAIGMLAYGRLGMKQSWDIDILVPQKALTAAGGVLERLGYRSVHKGEQFDRFMAAAHEIEFRAMCGFTVELHTRVARNRALLPEITADAAEQAVQVPGGTLRTLADAPLLAFLSVHGALHQWARLKWLADVNAFIAAREDTLAALVEEGSRLGARRSITVALLLCRELFRAPLRPDIERQLEMTRFTRLLVRRSLPRGEVRRMPIAPSPVALALQFRAERGLAHAVGHLGALWAHPGDRAQIALPRPARFLYHGLRFPLMVERRTRRLWHALGAIISSPAN